jgi:hypothetical protein
LCSLCVVTALWRNGHAFRGVLPRVCPILCDLETLTMVWPWPGPGFWATKTVREGGGRVGREIQDIT